MKTNKYVLFIIFVQILNSSILFAALAPEPKKSGSLAYPSRKDSSEFASDSDLSPVNSGIPSFDPLPKIEMAPEVYAKELINSIWFPLAYLAQHAHLKSGYVAMDDKYVFTKISDVIAYLYQSTERTIRFTDGAKDPATLPHILSGRLAETIIIPESCQWDALASAIAFENHAFIRFMEDHQHNFPEIRTLFKIYYGEQS